MKYTKGSIGRVFLIKFEDDEILISSLASLAKKEKISSAAVIFIGALKKGDLVTGPKKPVIPPTPNEMVFKDGWEVMGIGTIFTNSKKIPQVHIHASMGKKNKVLTGCVRGNSKVFLVIEAVVLELKGMKASKDIDLKTGLNLLKII
ncbi:MAG: PPC domain-containing DNA-binding protein [Candidatus Omnitrophota bacterium]